MIASAQTDPRYSSANYGVPVSAAEEAELARRLQLEADSHAAVDFSSRQTTWGGYYIDQLAKGAPVFLFTSGEDSMRAELERLLPVDSGFRVEHVAQSLAALRALNEDIVASWGDLRSSGIQITHTGIDLRGNSVTVGIDGLTKEAADELARRFGDGLVLRDQPAAIADACPETNCRPIKGGIMMTGDLGYSCTSGFVVRRTANGARLSILTAGHCNWVNGPINKPWYHTGNRFGDSKFHAFFQNTGGDVGIVEIDDDEAPSPANKVYLQGAILNVTGFVYDIYQTFGVQACVYGFASNDAVCTTITDIDETNQSCVTKTNGVKTCFDVLHTKEYGWNQIDGDSGGPIYQVSGSNRLALGTHVHSPAGGGPGFGWYTTFQQGRTAYVLASGGDSYSICTTPAC